MTQIKWLLLYILISLTVSTVVGEFEHQRLIKECPALGEIK